jgi:hypothetical protein
MQMQQVKKKVWVHLAYVVMSVRIPHPQIPFSFNDKCSKYYKALLTNKNNKLRFLNPWTNYTDRRRLSTKLEPTFADRGAP